MSHHKKTQSLVPLVLDLYSSEQEVPGEVVGEPYEPYQRAQSPSLIARPSSKQGRHEGVAECSSPVAPPGRSASNGSLSVGASPLGGGAAGVPARAAVTDVQLLVDGHRATASIDAEGLRWSYDVSRCCVPGVRSETVPFAEILSAHVLPPRRGIWKVGGELLSQLVVYTFRRSPANPASWHPRQVTLESAHEGTLHQWAVQVKAAVAQQPGRPRSLLVLINPFGGSRQARSLFASVVRPVFEKAGIKLAAVETQYSGHARQLLIDMPVEELAGYDGIVAIGGDGVFHEVINGLLVLRNIDSRHSVLAAALRIGHVPAGSTDAAAVTLNGTRSAFTAAMHIALGDRVPLDVLRIDMPDGSHEFACCMASYGFMGEVMAESEKYRWLGPLRYDVVGAKMLLQNQSFRVKLSYLPAEDHVAAKKGKVCTARCQLCSMHPSHSQRTTGFREASFSAQHRRPGQWQHVEDEFAGIMLVIMPCRSDKSKKGVARYGHLCDGAVHLVLVRKCSRLSFLRFLLTLSGPGLAAGRLSPYVEVIPCVAVKLEPVGTESHWNVDGELLHHTHLAAEVHRGVVECFARGVEVDT